MYLFHLVSESGGKWKSVAPRDAATVSVLRGRVGRTGMSEVDKYTLFCQFHAEESMPFY